MDTMQDVLTKLKAKWWLYIQLAFGLIFLGLIGLYTFSHNVNLMLQGTHTRFHIIGIVAATVGELFSRISGSQFVLIMCAPVLGCSPGNAMQGRCKVKPAHEFKLLM
jgi:hypothetical protein